jgi:alpha-beta hydrolase superfamily lysophospholipase
MTPRIPGFETRTVEVGGRPLRVAIGGDGPPVLLLHGFPQTSLAWREVAPRLAGHRVVCPDLPGYGASAGSDGGPEAHAKRATGDLPERLIGAEVWARWAPDLRTRVLPGGHLLPEERPAEVADASLDLLDG